MNADEAKFVLAASWSDHPAGDDPLLNEARALLTKDPALQAWFEREQSLDAAISARLAAVTPPPGLREEILLGARASRRPTWWTRLGAWGGAVAALFVVATFALRSPPVIPASTATLASFALEDVRHGRHQHGRPGTALRTLEDQLGSQQARLVGNLKLDPTAMENAACRSYALKDGIVYEVCFLRDGVYYHAYAMSLGDSEGLPRKPLIQEENGYVAASWVEDDVLLAVATRGSMADLEAVL